MLRSLTTAIAVGVLAGCTFQVSDDGRRLSESDIKGDSRARPALQPPVNTASWSVVSSNSDLSTLRAALNSNVGARLEVFGSLVALADGSLTRVDLNTGANQTFTVNPLGRAGSVTVSAFGAEYQRLCQDPFFGALFRPLGSGSTLAQRCNPIQIDPAVRDHLTEFSLETRPNTTLRWEAPRQGVDAGSAPVLVARVDYAVSQSQPGGERALIDIDWSQIVVDYRIQPTPCGGCNAACRNGGFFVYHPDGAESANSVFLPSLDLNVVAQSVSSNGNVDWNWGCIGLSLIGGEVPCALAFANADTAIKSAPPGIASSTANIFNFLLNPPRLFAPPGSIAGAALQMQVTCPGPNPLCLLPPASLPAALAAIAANASVDFGLSQVLVAGDSQPSMLGAAGGVWTNNTFRFMAKGGAVQSIQVDPTRIADLCTNSPDQCSGESPPNWCPLCPACALGICVPTNIQLGNPVQFPASPSIASFVQVFPESARTAREIFTRPGDLRNGYLSASMSGNNAVFSGIFDGDLDCAPEVDDNCPGVANRDQSDEDEDGVGDACDLCPGVAGGRFDADGDGFGDECDCDADGDGCNNQLDATTCESTNGDGFFDENPFTSVRTEDTCRSGAPRGANDCTPDDDGDGVPDASDNCPCVANPTQSDRNRDFIGDACDPICNQARNPPICNRNLNEPWRPIELAGPGPFRAGFIGVPGEVCSSLSRGRRIAGLPAGPDDPTCLPTTFWRPRPNLCVIPPCGENPRDSFVQIRTREATTVLVSAADLGWDRGFGSAIGVLRDADLDGRVDLAVTSPWRTVCRSGSCGNKTGEVVALGSARGDVLFRATGRAANEEYGTALAANGDRLYVGAPGAVAPNGARTGAVYVLDTSHSTPLVTQVVYGQLPDERFGESIHLLREEGTVTAVFVGAPNALLGAGRIYGMSPGGSFFACFESTFPLGYLGRRFDVVPPNPNRYIAGGLVAGIPNAFFNKGALVGYDLTGHQTQLVFGQSLTAELGTTVRTGDFDGDGSFDVAAGEPGANANSGRVRLLTSQLSSFGSVEGFASSRTGATLSAPGDLDGDGRVDLQIGLDDTVTSGGWIVASARGLHATGSCRSACGRISDGCACDFGCTTRKDCCADYATQCVGPD